MLLQVLLRSTANYPSGGGCTDLAPSPTESEEGVVPKTDEESTEGDSGEAGQEQPPLESGEPSEGDEPTSQPSVSEETNEPDLVGDGESTEDTSDTAQDPQPPKAEEPEAKHEEKAEQEANPPVKKHETPIESGTYVISNSLNWKQVLDVSKGSKSSGANVQVYGSNMTAAQQWKIQYDDEGLYTFVNVKSGKALDVSGGIMKNGRNVQQYNSNGTAAQKWIIISTPTGYKICSAKDSSFVLDLASGRAVNGGNIQIYRTNNTKAQRFWFLAVDPNVEAGVQEVADGVYVISSSKKGSLVLDAASAGITNGTNAQMYQSNSTIAQKWVLSYSQGFYTIANVASGKVLDVSGANLVPTTNV